MIESSVYFKGYITVLSCACLFVLLALPLVLRKVPRNSIYGYRTKRTLKNDEAWYSANAFFGWCLIAAGIVSAIAIRLLYTMPALAPNAFMMTSNIILVVPLAITILLTQLRIRKIDKGR